MTINPDLMSLPHLTAVLRSGELSPLTYFEELLHHFRQVEPDVQAFIPEQSRFLRLDKEAETLLKKYPNPKIRPPLFGVPIGVKDIFHVDHFATQAGSRLPLEILQGPEAASVTALRDQGALILAPPATPTIWRIRQVDRAVDRRPRWQRGWYPLLLARKRLALLTGRLPFVAWLVTNRHMTALPERASSPCPNRWIMWVVLQPMWPACSW